MDACDVPADMVEGYDLVILFDVYHDVPYPQQLVDGACKLLKKGGQFYMFDVDLHERVTDNKNNDRKYEIVVLNTKLARLVAAHANKKDDEKRRSPTKVQSLLVETHMQMLNFYRSLNCARGNESIIYFPTIYAI